MNPILVGEQCIGLHASLKIMSHNSYKCKLLVVACVPKLVHALSVRCLVFNATKSFNPRHYLSNESDRITNTDHGISPKSPLLSSS